MKKLISLILCGLLLFSLVACEKNQDESTTSEETIATPTDTSKISTMENVTTEYEEPLGGLTNPYNLYLQKDGTYITYDGKFLCDCDFDPNKEYKVGDTLIITTTLTNLTNEDLYFAGHIGGISISEIGTSWSFVDGPIRFCESGDTLSCFREIRFEKTGVFLVNIYRTFGVSNNNKNNMIESRYYRQRPSCTYKITVKE